MLQMKRKAKNRGQIMKYDLYDFDGTIYDGDSGVDLVFFAISKKPVVILDVLGSLGIAILYLLKLRTKEQMKTRLFRFLKRFDDIDGFVEEFWEKNESKIKEFWKKKKSHSKDIIISASGYFWLEPIAKKYKVKDLFATNVNPKTGEVIGNNCHGKEKVLLFKDKYPEAEIRRMYTDSINDLPLIEEAERGILVKKNKLYDYYEYKPNIIVRFWRWGWGIYHKNEELWNYLIVGVLTTIVSLSVYFICTSTFLDPENNIQLQIANVISWILAVAFAYITNRIYVFKSKSKEYLKEISSFVGARILSLLMDMLTMFLIVSVFHFNDKIGKLASQVIVTVANYVLSKLFVFKKGS